MRRFKSFHSLARCRSLQRAHSSPSRRRSTSRTRRHADGQVGVPYIFRFDMDDGQRHGADDVQDQPRARSRPASRSQNYGERFAEIRGNADAGGNVDASTSRRSRTRSRLPVLHRRSSARSRSPIELIVATHSLPDAPINQPYGPIQLTAVRWHRRLVDGHRAAHSRPALTLVVDRASSRAPRRRPAPSPSRVQAASVADADTKQLTHLRHRPARPGRADGVGAVQDRAGRAQLEGQRGRQLGASKRPADKAPYTYTSTTLPVGLTLNPDGTLTGASTICGRLTGHLHGDRRGRRDRHAQDASSTSRRCSPSRSREATRPARSGKAFRWKLPVTGASKTKLFVASGKYPPGSRARRGDRHPERHAAQGRKLQDQVLGAR